MRKFGILICVVSFIFFLFNMAYATPINIANTKGTATANSSYSTNTADLAIDNIVSATNYWNAGDQGQIGDVNWLTIDLGIVFNVNSIDLFSPLSDGYYSGNTTNYNVYYGFDNVNWTLVDTGIFVDETAQITDNFSFGTSGQNMRYVKYEVDGGTHWSAISEIKIWSDDNSGSNNPVPEPATMMLFGLGILGLAGVSRRKK